MFEKDFLEAVAERAIKTFAQAFLAIIGTNATGAISADMGDALKVAAVSALISVLTSFGSAQFGRGGPSLATESIAPDLVINLPEEPKKAVAAKKAPAKKTAATKTK
jgi:hypothetical protein